MPNATKTSKNGATSPLGYTTAMKIYGSWPAAVAPLLNGASRSTLRGAFRAAGMNPQARLSKPKMRVVITRFAPNVNVYYHLADAFVPEENS